MNLKGSAELNIDNINNINISDMDYDLKIMTNNVGITSKKREDDLKNGITINSSYGELDVSIDLMSQNLSELNTDNFNFIVQGKYKLDDNLKIGLKYEADAKNEGDEILSGTIDSHIDMNQIRLNLNTENIIYGKEYHNDLEHSVFGNKINPSIGISNNVSLGYMYENKEIVDEYGNNEDKSKNKLKLNLDF